MQSVAQVSFGGFEDFVGLPPTARDPAPGTGCRHTGCGRSWPVLRAFRR